MNSYKLVALDMDGTLLNSSKEISPMTLAAIEEASKAGKYVALSTGRCIAELRDYFKLIPSLRYVICMSGALVYDIYKREAIYSNGIPANEVKTVLDVALKRDVLAHLLTVEESIVEIERGSRLSDYFMGPYQKMYDAVATKVPEIREYFNENSSEVHKLNLYHRSHEERVLCRKELQELCDKKELHLELVYSEKTSLECSLVGTTKGTGLIKLCEHLGLSIEETIAVGDADNDIDILNKAGLAIAMGNANDNVKAISDYVVSDNDSDGCAEVIQKYLL